MKVIREPKVYLVGYQVVNCSYKEGTPGLKQFLDDEGVPNWETDADRGCEKIPEVAGRVCYMSFGKPRPGGNQAYLRHILEVGHGSVLEHACWNFIVTGISRSCSHELVRHRAGWSYSQLSQRYVDESVAECVVPHDLAKEVDAAEKFLSWWYNKYLWSLPVPDGIASILGQIVEGRVGGWDISEEVVAGLQWLLEMHRATDTYEALVDALQGKILKEAYEETLRHVHKESFEEWKSNCTAEQRTGFRKAARQAARSVLPNATETKVFFTANARALRHFIELRASRHAEPEIRKVAVAVLKILQQEAPHLFGDYALTQLPDGTFEASTTYRKV